MKTRGLQIQMANCLLDKCTDLGDERDVIRTLQAAEYRSGDIAILMDGAIEIARVRRAAWARPGDVA